MRTAKPVDESRKASDLRTGSSSSTMWMTMSASLMNRLRGDWQGEAEGRAARLVAVAGEVAAVGLNDATGDRQANPHASGLGGHERLKQALRDFRRYSWAGIGHVNAHQLAIDGCRSHSQFATRTFFHRFHR